jgi:hypothetical protein
MRKAPNVDLSCGIKVGLRVAKVTRRHKHSAVVFARRLCIQRWPAGTRIAPGPSKLSSTAVQGERIRNGESCMRCAGLARPLDASQRFVTLTTRQCQPRESPKKIFSGTAEATLDHSAPRWCSDNPLPCGPSPFA